MSAHVRVIARLKPNSYRAGIAACALGPEVRAMVADVGERALQYAQLTAPADSTSYLRGLRLDVEEVPDIPFRRRGEPMARWAGIVVASAPDSIIVEVGAKATPDYRVLGRTLEWLEVTAR